MFATLLAQEARTQARRNAGVVGIAGTIAVVSMLLGLLRLPVVSSLLMGGSLLALIAIPVVVAVHIGVEYWQSMYGARGYLTMSLPVRGRTIFVAKTLYAVIAVVAATAVAAALGGGWLAVVARLNGLTLEQFLTPARQTIDALGTGMLIFLLASVVEALVVTIIEVAAVMSIGAQGRWNRLGFGAPAIGFIILYLVNQVVGLAATVLLPMSIDLAAGRFTARIMLPEFIEAVRTDADPGVVGIGTALVSPILAAVLAWWAVRAIERHTCLR